MPYSSAYNNASSNVGAAILTSFFENAPRIPADGPQPETLVVFRCHFEGPAFLHAQDRGEAIESKEDSASDTNGEIYSTYATPVSPTPSSFSFDIEVTVTPDH
jgi:hypothetical protein